MSEFEDELLISVIIATRNEESHIEHAIRSALSGTVDPRRMEVVVVDGRSTDGTRQVVAALADEFPGSVRLIDNPRKITPTAFNLGILAARGEYLCILSAHGGVDENYFQVCLDKLAASDDVDVVGGTEIVLPCDNSIQARKAMAILSSRFGVGASSRNSQTDGPVDTISPGLFRRRVFERVGMFDERLVRNQDNELSSRLIHSGGTIYMISRIKSYYRGRQTLHKMLRQCYANGLYGILTWRVNPSSFRLRHGIPLFFLLFLVCGGIMALAFPMFAWLYAGVLGLYGLMAVAASVQDGLKFRLPAAVLFPGLFLAMHLSYGIGTFLGIFRFGIRKLPPNRVQKLPPREKSEERWEKSETAKTETAKKRERSREEERSACSVGRRA